MNDKVDYPLVSYEELATNEVDVTSLTPQEGKIKTESYKPAVDAVYFTDHQNNILAYVTFSKWFGSDKEVVIESFTNEKYRKLGVQKRLNEYLIRKLKSEGVEKIVGRIMIDNSSSLLNRLQMKDPDSGKILLAEIEHLDQLDIAESVDPHELWVYVSLTKTVESNINLLKQLAKIQKKLTSNRFNNYLKTE